MKPCYRKNDEYITLPKGSETTSLYISGGDVFISGNTYGFGSVKPCFWKNGEYFELSGDSKTTSYQQVKKERAAASQQ
ncbi:MAG: hypothetical protein JW881_00435 [Spirochaetales bacterium]|nr:hypothetical protein [Spirochaetales bacterium]